VGQKKEMEFRVLWVAGDAHDDAPMLSNRNRMTEAEALTRLDSKRLIKKKRKKVVDDDDDDDVDDVEIVENAFFT